MEEKTAVYQQRIRAVRPNLTFQDIQVITEGMVNDVVIVNSEYVFRFGKQTWAAEDLQQEANCLQLAQAHVAIPLPRWTIHAPDFVSYTMIPGVPLQQFEFMKLPQQAQANLAKQIGTFLYQLHTIPMTKVNAHHIQPSVTNRTHEKWLQLYEDVQKELFPYMMQVTQAWVHQLFAPVIHQPDFLAYAPAFVNGDLASYHLLYNPQTQLLNGIIDFGTAGIGDPAVDFACLLDQYGETFVRRISTYYPGVAALIDRARFWAGTLVLQWTLGGFRHPADPSWFTVHIGRARDVSPVGSGWSTR